MRASLPRLCVASASSGAGKTSFTLGLLRALGGRGLRVQAFKSGPDYIDPGLHAMVGGRPSANLDTRLMDEETVLALFAARAATADISIVEGAMGYFDGDGSGRGSSAELASLLKSPVLLLLDLRASAESAAALALGFVSYRRPSRIAGFVLNRVGGEGHARSAARAIEKATGLPVLGYIPKDPGLSLPERHLGLVSGGENPAFEKSVATMARAIEANCDLESVLRLARVAPRLPADLPLPWGGPRSEGGGEASLFRPRIAVARDEAFSFYYDDNFEALRGFGADLAFFSPLADSRLPEGSAGLYLGGGYPELHAAALGGNKAMREAIFAAGRSGLPILAECGGYMYLTEAIEDLEGGSSPGVGLVPGRARMTRGRVALGYHEGLVLRPSPFVAEGEILRGHCFHWSRIEGLDESRAAIELRKPATGSGGGKSPLALDGYCGEAIFASYLHIHFASHPALARDFVGACARYARARYARARNTSADYAQPAGSAGADTGRKP